MGSGGGGSLESGVGSREVRLKYGKWVAARVGLIMGDGAAVRFGLSVESGQL